MITKAQSKRYTAERTIAQSPKLTAMEKGLLRWSMAERGDKVLDAQVGSGVMLEYLHRNMECEICGISDDMESVRRSRSRLLSADIAYATREDIPWKEDTFDCVYIKQETMPLTKQAMEEALRVLKPGGQLLVGLKTIPAPFRQLAGLWHTEADSSEMLKPRMRTRTMAMMNEQGCTQITCEATGILNSVCIGWKPQKTVEEALQ